VKSEGKPSHSKYRSHSKYVECSGLPPLSKAAGFGPDEGSRVVKSEGKPSHSKDRQSAQF
jgi:hypothetical protein